MTNRKGIILAGGSGSRLRPLTQAISKQLLPVYDKPMIYYPLSVLMLSGIQDIAIITTPEDQVLYQRLLGDGSQWKVNFTWIVQPFPHGLAQAYILAEEFLAGMPSALILGDNIFFGHGLWDVLRAADTQEAGGTVFAHRVADPGRYGVVDFDQSGRVNAIIEKPENPPSNYAVTGLYFLDGRAPKFAKKVTPSARGELEIVSVLEQYRHERSLKVEKLGRGYAWFDTGTHSSLLDAGNFVRTLTQRQGQQVGSPDEVAFHLGWITRDELAELAKHYSKNEYGKFLRQLAKSTDFELSD